MQRSELIEQLNSAELAQAHIPPRAEIMEWFDRLQKIDGCKNNLQRQVIRTFVHKVYLWGNHAVIVLTLNNTQETVTFEEIRKSEQTSEKTQKPLPDYAESGKLSYNAGDTAKKKRLGAGKCVVE